MFAEALADKPHARFVRHYDARRPAQHSRQKVSAMKFWLPPKSRPKITNYSFRLGVQYRHRPDNFDSSGFFHHARTETTGNEIRCGCGAC
jgi:hypothetical protein